jgi:hypothetical protein
MYTIDHAEQALRQCRHDEKTLQRYSVAVLQELCAKNSIQVDEGCSRRLKKPYINAILSHVRQHSSSLVTTIDSRASRGKGVTETQNKQD